jgi:hypothetical protein
MDVAPPERAVKPRLWHGAIDGAAEIPLIPAQSASKTRVNALMPGIQG